mmetsp:Transcript_167965/g.297557  ORF Transcript_167965/g.297557 Transcript_167965/m.297557 type:complete len:565 (-) Transcript_167965:119-1813(-)
MTASSEALLGDSSSDKETCVQGLKTWASRLNEFAKAVIPLSLFIILYCGIFVQAWFITVEVVAGLLCVTVGLTFFKYGLTFGLMPFAEDIGDLLPHKQGPLGIVIISAVLGTVVTFAEPGIDSLQMVGKYVEKPAPLLKWLLMEQPFILLSTIALGVGIAAGLGMLRIRYQFRFFYILVTTVPVCLIISVVFGGSSLSSIMSLAWDSGCITTGPATVPIVLALGQGLSKASSGDGTPSGFGVVTLASLFPILTVLLCGLLVVMSGAAAEDIKLDAEEEGEFGSVQEVVIEQVSTALHSILPLTAYLLLVQVLVIREKIKQPLAFAKGVLFAFVGLSIFNCGLYYGSLKLGDEAGNALPKALKEFHGIGGAAIILVFGFVIGLIATFIDLEPCGMGELVENVTHGKIKKSELFFAIASGVGMGVMTGFSRVLYGWNLNYVLLVGYPIAILISQFSDETVACIAWDSSGVTTGPVTVPLVLSLGVGIADVTRNQAFGILACVPPFGITFVLILGLLKMPPPELVKITKSVSSMSLSDLFTPKASKARWWQKAEDRPHSLADGIAGA